MAKLLKERLGAPAWLPAKPDAFTTAAEKRTIVGDLTDGKESEELPIRVVTGADGAALEDKASPIVLMGDSHCLVFHAGTRQPAAPRQVRCRLLGRQEADHLVFRGP